jgi:hypothetical protein
MLLIRRRRPIGEPPVLEPLDASGLATLAGSAAAGRLVLALTEAGVRCDDVVQLVIPAEAGPDLLRSTHLDATFGTVALGSHLVNLPDEARRAAFMELAAGHVGAGGSLIVEHHPLDWAETAADVEPTPGSSVGMEDVRRDPPFVTAVSVYDLGGRMFRQPFTARVLSEPELADVVAGVGFRISRRLSATLIEARRGLDMHDLRSGDGS